MYVLSKRIGIKVVFLDREIPNLELEPVIPFHQLLLPYPKLQNLDNTPLTRHKYHTMVTCSGNSAGNSMEIPRKYDGNITGILRINNHRTKIVLPKDTRQKVGKTHERYNERKPVSIFTIDETITPSQFKLQGSYTPRKTKDRNSDGIVTAPPQNLWQKTYLTLYLSFNLNTE